MSEREEVIKCFEVEPGSWEHFVHTGELDNAVKDELYDYWANNGEMPYGVQKARTGDPDDWIAYRLAGLFQDVLGSNEPNGEQPMEAAKTKVQKAIEQLREHDKDQKIKVGSFLDYLLLERKLTKETRLDESAVKRAMHAVQGMKPRQAVSHLKKAHNMSDDVAGKFAYDAHKNPHRKETPTEKK